MDKLSNMRHLMILLCCSCLLETVAATNPGLKAKISQAGIQYAANVATEIMQREVNNLEIPDQHGQTDLDIGQVKHSLTNITIKSFNPPTTTVSTMPFHWSLKGTSVVVSANWEYDYKAFGFVHIADSGSMDVAISLDLDTTIELDADSSGRLRSSLIHCSCNVTKLDASIHGSWIYSLLDTHIESYVRLNMQSLICEEVDTIISNKTNTELASMPLSFTLHDVIVVDYSLVSPPTFTPNSIELAFKGQLSWLTNPEYSTFNPVAIPESNTQQHQHMVGFWMTQSTINNLGSTVFRHNVLQYNFTASDLAESDRYILATTCTSFFYPCFGRFFPKVRKLYPHTHVSTRMRVTEPPRLDIKSDGVTTNWAGLVEYYVTPDTGSPQFLFSTNVRVVFNVSVELWDLTLTASITDFNFDMSLHSSAIGDVRVSSLNNVINLALLTAIVPRLNALGREGLTLPMIQDVSYRNPKLQLMQGAVYAGVDVQYSPKQD